MVDPLFTTFNFRVELKVPQLADLVCNAEFAECDGLEISMEPKTIRAGGHNLRQIHLVGPVSYGQLALKRGMTRTFHLWQWFDQVVQGNGGLRASGEVVMLGSDRSVQLSFALTRCLPIKIKAPALNAKEGLIAIEEMQIVYEQLRVQYPQ